MKKKNSGSRCILLLQGHPSGFWRCLGNHLDDAGHKVIKVNFCLADRVYWGARAAQTFRGSFSDWPEWVSDLIQCQGVTDILYYADRFPYHVAAQAIARKHGVRCWVLEFGYLRPDWITFEPDGMGAYSRFPKTAAGVRALARKGQEPDRVLRYPYDFVTEAFHEVTFNLTATAGRPFYPLYHDDRYYWPIVEYLSWLPQLMFSRRREKQATELIERMKREKTPFNLVALQLQSDYQIRASGQSPDIRDFLHVLFESFAKNAPDDRRLVIKIHPLDNGLERWFFTVPTLARQFGLKERVEVFKGGDLGECIALSKGVLLVNSTVGIHALRAGVPTYAWGSAVYNVPGLTHQGDLETFWTSPEAVDPRLFADFEKALSTIQIKGSFYNKAGQVNAALEICNRLEQQG